MYDSLKITPKTRGFQVVFNHTNFHLYHYAGNNPIRYTDPDGRLYKRLNWKTNQTIDLKTVKNDFKNAQDALKTDENTKNIEKAKNIFNILGGADLFVEGSLFVGSQMAAYAGTTLAVAFFETASSVVTPVGLTIGLIAFMLDQLPNELEVNASNITDFYVQALNGDPDITDCEYDILVLYKTVENYTETIDNKSQYSPRTTFKNVTKITYEGTLKNKKTGKLVKLEPCVLTISYTYSDYEMHKDE